MPIDSETIGRQPLQGTRATSHIEDPRTGTAQEMMVVRLAAQLVACVFSRQLHQLHRPLLHEGFQVAVDGGDADPRRIVLRQLEDFRRQQRSLRRSQGCKNGVALAG